VAALTFDDGPHPEHTCRLLEILARHGAKATFFMVGRSAERYPEIVERAAHAGHAIANHTWDHAAMPLLGRRERLRQMLACEQALTPYGSRLFRPPYGFQSRASYLDARGLGYTVVGWSGTAEDWLDHSADGIADRLIHNITPGGIILLHDVLHDVICDAYADRSPLLEAVDRVLEALSGRYRFLTVPELLAHGRVRRVFRFRAVDRPWLEALGSGPGRAYDIPAIPNGGAWQ
jgi:peptidoglycan-N-acetylglucosamine deacetylase